MTNRPKSVILYEQYKFIQQCIQKGKHMKKLSIILVLMALFCVILTAVSCGESATTTADTTKSTTPAATTTTLPTVSTTLPATTPVVTTTTTAVTTTAITTTTVATKPDPDMSPVSKTISIASAFKKKTFEASNGIDLPYRIFVPEDYSEEYAYPLVLFLHGAGERGNNNTSQLNNVIPNLFKEKDSPFYHAIVIAPQCPTDMQWVDTPWANGSYLLKRTPISEPMTAVVELLDYIVENYSVNQNRQYVTGLSMGGFGTWDLLMRYPERFAAAIPYCGAADPNQAANLAKIPIWTFHDTKDTTVPCKGTQAVVKRIQEAGGTLITYTETSQYGHDVWTPGSQTEGLFEWLFAQRKK